MRKGFVVVVSLIIGLLLSACQHKASSTFPSGIECKVNDSFHFLNDDIWFSPHDDTRKIYVLQNTSNTQFWVNHQSQRSMNAGWGVQLKPNSWSVLLLNSQNFNMLCNRFVKGKTQSLNCANFIKVCQVTDAYISKTAYEHWLLVSGNPQALQTTLKPYLSTAN